MGLCWIWLNFRGTLPPCCSPLNGALGLTFLSVEDGRQWGRGVGCWPPVMAKPNKEHPVWGLNIGCWTKTTTNIYQLQYIIFCLRIMNVLHIILHFIQLFIVAVIVFGFQMGKRSCAQYECSNPRSLEHRAYPESLSGVISWSIKGAAISQFSQQQQLQASVPIGTPFTRLCWFRKGVRAHSGSSGLSWLQIRLCVISLFSYGKHMTMNCSTIGLCVYVYTVPASPAAWTEFLNREENGHSCRISYTFRTYHWACSHLIKAICLCV